MRLFFEPFSSHTVFTVQKQHAIMKSIQGTKTEQNLLKAFAGESQARNRYTLFAQKAKEEGYEQIMGIFAETEEQEAEWSPLRPNIRPDV